MPDTNQVQRVLSDPNFHALPVEERTKVLSRLDPNFSALPSEEQVKVVSQGAAGTTGTPIHSQATIGPYKPGWSDRIMDWVNQKIEELRPGTDISGAFDPKIQARQRLAGQMLSGPFTGVPEFVAGASRVMGSKSPNDTRPYYRRALQGGTEEISGLANSLSPAALVASPNAIPAVAGYGFASKVLSEGTNLLPL